MPATMAAETSSITLKITDTARDVVPIVNLLDIFGDIDSSIVTTTTLGSRSDVNIFTTYASYKLLAQRHRIKWGGHSIYRDQSGQTINAKPNNRN